MYIELNIKTNIQKLMNRFIARRFQEDPIVDARVPALFHLFIYFHFI